MFDIQNYTSFLAAILVFQLIPGAGTVTILNATARNGIGAGLGAVLGTLVGDFLFMVAAVTGLAAVMNANPIFFQALQWFGAAYLCRLGLRLLRLPMSPDVTHSEPHESARLYFRQACAVSLTNPKVVLFFVAFFPLFLRHGSSNTTLVAMMAHVTIITFLYQAGLVLVGNALARRLKAIPSARRIAIRLAGISHRLRRQTCNRQQVAGVLPLFHRTCSFLIRGCLGVGIQFYQGDIADGAIQLEEGKQRGYRFHLPGSG